MQYSFKVLIIAVLAMFSSAPLFAQKMEPDATVKYADRDTCALYMDIYELYDIQPDMDLAETRWKIEKGGRGILWGASEGLPHEDHIEMSGEKVSCVLRWGVTADHAFRSEKSLVFPMLRTIPNNTHASMNFRIATDVPSLFAVNGRSLIRERVDSVRINGMVEVSSLWSKANDFIGVGGGLAGGLTEAFVGGERSLLQGDYRGPFRNASYGFAQFYDECQSPYRLE